VDRVLGGDNTGGREKLSLTKKLIRGGRLILQIKRHTSIFDPREKRGHGLINLGVKRWGELPGK